MKLKSILICGIVALSLTFVFSMKADAISDMRKEVLSSKTKLPEDGKFNVIAEPFDWGKDVTRVMINVGSEVSESDLSTNAFKVYAEHYSEQARKNDSQGERKVLKAYPVDEEGNVVDSSNYVVLNLEYGAGVRAAHLGSYEYASYYTSLSPKYQVSWNGKSYRQQDVVNLILDEFKLAKHEFGGNHVGYGFYKPEDTDNKHPLIVYFHGMGEGGTDNPNCEGSQMFAYPECAFADKNIQEIMGGAAYVLLPQSPATWPTNGFTAESAYLPVVNNLIDKIISDNPGIDENRIYVGGLSMGGFMCSRVILSRPEKYAAAFPCSQAYAFTDDDARKLKELPIWISCCEKDGTCRMDPYTYASYQKLVNAQSKVAKCVVMEGQNNDPRSMFRFYSSDMNNYIRYEAVHENHPNRFTGDFVWENAGYGGHNGGWVPVFANGEFYKIDANGEFCADDKSDNKITIMEWLAAQSLVQSIEVDSGSVKKEYSVGEAFNPEGITVTAKFRDGSEKEVTDFSVAEVDTSKEGTVSVKVSYGGVEETFDITVKASENNIGSGDEKKDNNVDSQEQNSNNKDNNGNSPSKVTIVDKEDKTTQNLSTSSSSAIAKIKGIKVKKKGSKAIVSWKPDANAKKYEVLCANKKNFKKGLKKKVVSGKKSTFKKLKKGRKYFFKVRGIADAEKGKFSAVKKIKL